MKKIKQILRKIKDNIKDDADGSSPCRDCMRFGSCENCIYG